MSGRRPSAPGLRLGLLGYGWVADVHCRAARDAGLEVVVVAGHQKARAQAFADDHGIARAADDWQAVCEDETVDAVVVATPNSLHAPHALRALAAGKHVLVEKPMATAVVDAEAMVAAATSADRTLAVGHMWRYRREVIELRDRVARGELGRIVRTHGYGLHAGWGPSGWFADPQLAGGGALIDMGIHAIDTARFLLGDPEPGRVQASLGTGYRDLAVDDDGVVLIDWQSGVRSVVESGWWQPRLGGAEAETVLLGTAGWAQLWPAIPPLPAGYEHCSVPMFTAQLEAFAIACAGGPPPPGSAEVGLTALRIVEAAYAVGAVR